MLAAALLLVSGCSDGRAARELRALTDAPARLVWVRQLLGTRDFFATHGRFQLMGLDTEDRLGERIILPGPASYHKPLLTDDGSRIVFTDVVDETIYVVNWDGTGLRELAPGLADEVWRDPHTGSDWVYSIPTTLSAKNPVQPLTRFRLDDPSVREIVLEKVPLNADNLQVSRDGLRMGVQHPWPAIGVLDLESGTITDVGRGCWPGMAPADRPLMWIFDGPHRNLLVRSLEGNRTWTVNINGAPGIDGYEVYHPRWSNRIRFFCMTGPYRLGLFKATADVGLYAGRFSESVTNVEAWVRVTADNGHPDFYPDLWVQPKTGRYAGQTSVADPSYGSGSAVPLKHILATVQLLERTPTPTPADIAPYTRSLVVYRYAVETLQAGALDQSQILVAHWGLDDGHDCAPDLQIGETVELALDPYAARRDLEGERLVMELSDTRLPLFYDARDD